MIQSYIHQHVWLQFVSLSLSMASIIHATCKTPTDADNKLSSDEDYVKSAIVIHNQCIDLAMKCLMKVPKDDYGMTRQFD